MSPAERPGDLFVIPREMFVIVCAVDDCGVDYAIWMWEEGRRLDGPRFEHASRSGFEDWRGQDTVIHVPCDDGS